MATEIASAQDNAATVVTRDRGQKGLTGDDGIDGAGFNQVRQSLLDSPLCRLFAPNNIAPVLAGSLTATRSTTATYVDRYGVVQTAAIDEMREEADGWLIEGASTNLALHSEDFTNAVWTTTGSATVSGNAATAPDGANTADRIDFTANSEAVTQAYVNSTVADFTFSIWVRSPSSDRDVRVTIRNTPTTANRTDLDVTATSEWVRHSVTFTSVAESVAFQILSIAGDLDIDVWGAQLEESPYAKSYIPTTTASVTRAADDITAPANNNTPDLSKPFSVSFNLNALGIPTSGTDLNYLFALDNGQTATGMPFVLLRSIVNGNILARYADGVTTSDSTAALFGGTNYSVSYVFTGSSLDFYINGVLNTSVPVSNLTTTDTASLLYLGRRSTDTAQNADSKLRDFKIYDFALNADEITYLAGV